jgi:hypothetical protein
MKSKRSGLSKLAVVTTASLAAGVTAVSLGSAAADVIDLTFEGINSTYPSGFAFGCRPESGWNCAARSPAT